MEKSIKKLPILIHTTIVMLIVWIQAIAKLYYLQGVEFVLLRFMSYYLIVCYPIYLYGICKENLYIVETFKSFYRFLLVYLFLFMITFCVLFHSTDLINDFLIDVNKNTINLFRGMSPEDAYKKSAVILYFIETFQMVFFAYTVYIYTITKRFINDLKNKELKEYEEARAREEGIIAHNLEEDENRTVINVDVNVQNGNGQEDATIINDGDNLEIALEDMEHVLGNTNTKVERNNDTSRNE